MSNPREVVYRDKCYCCGRPVAVRLTHPGRRAYYTCRGELTEDGSHCGLRVTEGIKTTREKLAKAERAKGQTKPAAPAQSKGDKDDDGKRNSERGGGTGGGFGLGDW